MGSSILRFICRKAAGAGISRQKGGGGGRMMSTTTSTIEPCKISPWLMVPPDEGSAHKFYSLAEEKVVSMKKEATPPWAKGRVKLVGSSHGWLAYFNSDNLHTFLSDPITGRHIKLPDIHTLPASSFHPSCPREATNIILSSSPTADDDCRAVMTFGPRRRLAVCFPRRSTKWLPFGDQLDYEALVYSSRQKRLFCITWDDVVECWDLAGPSIVWKQDSFFEDEDEDEDFGWYYPRYLVIDEHSDRLFLVKRRVLDRVGRDGSYVKRICFSKYSDSDESYPYKTFGFDVFEIDCKGDKIRYMDGSLDGLAMFVGQNHSFALPAVEFPELRPDSIYFTDHGELDDDDNGLFSFGGHDIGMFNYVDSKLSSIYYSCHVSQITKIGPAMWFTPIPHNH